MDELSRGFLDLLREDWRRLARPEQLPPDDFSVWLFLAGRGSGKNWAMSHYVHEMGSTGAAKRIAIVGATKDAVEFTMVEGQAGLLAAAGSRNRPKYESGQLTWPSGSVARLFSADAPELLRGTEHDLAWCDELASWRRAVDAWENLIFTMRLGKKPKIVISTTPKPTALIRDLVKREGQDGIVISRSTTYANRSNLPASFFAELTRKYEGSRVGRQELMAELLLDTPGALWSIELLENTRVKDAPEKGYQRIVVGVDPSGSSSAKADETGIVVAGLGHDGHFYVIKDYSGTFTPSQWAQAAVNAYRTHHADRVVVEKNFGGDLVIDNIRNTDPSVPLKAVTSSKSKTLRAEPIASLFEQNRAHIIDSMPKLEDQMTSYTPESKDSPDRLDAAVFALTELSSGAAPGNYFNTGTLLVDGEPDVIPECTQEVFGVLATTPRAGSAVGLVILARSPSDVPARLHILDWMLAEVDQALTIEWLSAAYARVTALAKEWSALSGPPQILLEMSEFGQASFEVCAWHYDGGGTLVNLCKIDRRRGVPIPTVEQLAETTRAKINSGAVKIGREAYERQVLFRSATTNHLTAQLVKFAPEARDAPAELVAALCTGVSLWDGGVAVDASSVPAEPAAPAFEPPPPLPLGIHLPPGNHVIDGETVSVPRDGDNDLTFVHLSLGRHLVNNKITYIRNPDAGFKFGFNVN